MPHTNNAYAADRKASRKKNKPAFLAKKKKAPPAAASASDPTTDTPEDPSSSSREAKTALIREFHALEKQLKSPQTTSAEREVLLKRQAELGGLETYQKASLHGADKSRGGETSKWLIKQLKQFKVALDGADKGKEKAQDKVEPTVLEDGTKVWPKPKERRKLKLLDVGAIAGTAYASEGWIDTTSIDLNPQAPHVIKTNFFDFPVPEPSSEAKLYDVVSLSLVMNFEGSLINRGHFLLHAHSYLKRQSPGYLYLVLPLPCLTNSRYLTHQHFRQILASTNWEVVAHHDSSKLTHWFLKETTKGCSDDEGDDKSTTTTTKMTRRGDGKVWKREEVRRGVERNNFCIVVKPDEGVERDVEGEQDREVTGEEPAATGPDAVKTEGAVGKKGETTTTKNSKPNGKKRNGGEKAAPNATAGAGAAGAGNKKRKAQEDESAENATADGETGKEGEQPKKKKKSKPVKGKKTVFGDDE